ncbi:hypothetical protein C8R44DRAFT_922119 [Mycena epipterygia]|nr:hypothetical protein C8R44DRAFT_922119 [Mycena epipterygia]
MLADAFPCMVLHTHNLTCLAFACDGRRTDSNNRPRAAEHLEYIHEEITAVDADIEEFLGDAKGGHHEDHPPSALHGPSAETGIHRVLGRGGDVRGAIQTVLTVLLTFIAVSPRLTPELCGSPEPAGLDFNSAGSGLQLGCPQVKAGIFSLASLVSHDTDLGFNFPTVISALHIAPSVSLSGPLFAFYNLPRRVRSLHNTELHGVGVHMYTESGGVLARKVCFMTQISKFRINCELAVNDPYPVDVRDSEQVPLRVAQCDFVISPMCILVCIFEQFSVFGTNAREQVADRRMPRFQHGPEATSTSGYSISHLKWLTLEWTDLLQSRTVTPEYGQFFRVTGLTLEHSGE